MSEVAVLKIFEKLKLTPKEIQELYPDYAPESEKMHRQVLLMGIYEDLSKICKGPEIWIQRWLRIPRPDLGNFNESPLEFMQRKGLVGMFKVRNYILEELQSRKRR